MLQPYEETVWLTNWLWSMDASRDEVQPLKKLCQHDITRLTQVHDNHMNTVDISNKLIIDHVVRLVAREFPHTYVTHSCHTWAHCYHLTAISTIFDFCTTTYLLHITWLYWVPNKELWRTAVAVLLEAGFPFLSPNHYLFKYKVNLTFIWNQGCQSKSHLAQTLWSYNDENHQQKFNK